MPTPVYAILTASKDKQNELFSRRITTNNASEDKQLKSFIVNSLCAWPLYRVILQHTQNFVFFTFSKYFDVKRLAKINFETKLMFI